MATNTKNKTNTTTTSKTTTTETTSFANKNFGNVSGSISNQTNSGCPSALRVVSASATWLQGYYEVTNQTRRGQPVWYNKQKMMFLLVAKSLSWHIKPSKNYNADDTLTYAYSEAKSPSGKVWCPQNLVNIVWATGKWTRDIKVLGKIKYDLHEYFIFDHLYYKPLSSVFFLTFEPQNTRKNQ